MLTSRKATATPAPHRLGVISSEHRENSCPVGMVVLRRTTNGTLSAPSPTELAHRRRLGLAAAVAAASIPGATSASADAGAGDNADGIVADVQPFLSEQLDDLGAAVPTVVMVHGTDIAAPARRSVPMACG